MTGAPSKESKKEVMKDIILKLHQGMPLSEAKERFEREIGNISSTEIAALEQSLIDEGLSPEEIKKFCNVHALLFQSALEKAAAKETSPSHPVYLFKQENRQIEKLTGEIRAMAQKGAAEFSALKEGLKERLLRLREIEKHYERKEQLLFPYLEKHGFMGPSKVMWGKDNEIRDMMKAALSGLEGLGQSAFEAYAKNTLFPLLEEVEGMIFKEENILFPTSLEMLSPAEWVDILRESDEIGYVFIQKPQETETLIAELKAALMEEAFFKDDTVFLPSGSLSLRELMHLLNTLPVDLTFVDRDDSVKYFTEGRERIFHRPRAVISRKVQNCHPPQSLDKVEKILASFKEGKKDFYEFWINYQGRLVHIRYFAVRDREGRYLGALEVTQDVTAIKKLEGEKRLLDEGD